VPLLYYWRSEHYLDEVGRGWANYRFARPSPRIHWIEVGDSVWAFTRNQNGEYVLACELVVAEKYHAMSRYGSFAVRGAVRQSRYFDINRGPSVEQLIRGIIEARSDNLGHSFRGAGAVRPISEFSHQCLREFAKELQVIRAKRRPSTRGSKSPDAPHRL
jgi:hypothetical protein